MSDSFSVKAACARKTLVSSVWRLSSVGVALEEGLGLITKPKPRNGEVVRDGAGEPVDLVTARPEKAEETPAAGVWTSLRVEQTTLSGEKPVLIGSCDDVKFGILGAPEGVKWIACGLR